MLKGDYGKRKATLTWTSGANEAFQRTKDSISEAVTTAFLSPSQPLALHTDASDLAVGAALNQQRADGSWAPLGFFSRKLSSTEQRYSTFDRELLAVHSAIKHFQRILEGRPFITFSDHKPLSFALTQKADKYSPRQSRQLHFVAQFYTTIVYQPGSENVVADAFSRVETISMPTAFEMATIAKEQENDVQLPHLLDSQRIKLHRLEINGHTLACTENDGVIRSYLPLSLRRQAFDIVNNMSHPSGRATSKRLLLKFFWPSLCKDAVRWAKQCIPCQRAKVHRHNRAKLGNFDTPDDRFAHIHIDLVKMPELGGFANCLTIIDRYTRWPQAIPVKDSTAQTVAKALFDEWISFFGTPTTITADQGKQFESELLMQLARIVGAKHIHTTPYHPKGNGMVERMHRTLKAALKCCPETPWMQALPTVLLGLRTTFKEDLQASPAEMVFGTSLRILGEFFSPQAAPSANPSDFVSKLRQLFAALQPVPAARHSTQRPFVFKELASCEYVFRRVESIRKPLEAPYTGPHRVIKRIDDRTFVIDVNGAIKTLSTDQLKLAHLETADDELTRITQPAPWQGPPRQPTSVPRATSAPQH